MTRIVEPDARGIAEAVDTLRRGGIIGLPTETVYGLAADATNDDALRRVFAVKGRPLNHPLIVHIADARQLDDLARDVSDACRVLIDYAWPGPLTVIVRANDRVSRVATGGRDTVAVRLPAHAAAQAIITQLGHPIAAPSANRFGHVSPTSARHVADDLGDDVDLVVDGGECDVGVESTIVDCTLERPEILRPGAITAEEVHRLLDEHGVAMSAEVSGESRAPGMLERHYAPRAFVVLHESRATVPSDATFVIDCGAKDESDGALSGADDMVTAGRTLYSRLRDADQAGVPVVHAVLPPARGLGHALRDRLSKAAAGRTPADS